MSTRPMPAHGKPAISRQSRRGVLTAATAAVALSALGVRPVSAQADPIRIGLLLPFKGVYGVAAEGLERGFLVAVAEHEGRIGGRKIEIIRADTELTPNVGVQRFNKLVQSDKVDLVAGVISSSVGIALSELADRRRIPTVFINAFADEITGKFCSPYVARTSFSANAYQYATGKYLASTGLKRVVTMGPDYSAGRAFLNAFKNGFEDHGGTVVQQIWTPFQKTRDWGGALTQARSADVEAIYSFFGGNEAIQVVKQHADFGMRETLPLIGDQWLYDEVLWPAMGDLIDGVQYTTVHYPGIDTPANQRFITAYQKQFDAMPDVNAAIGYDNGKAIMLTLEKLGGKMPKDGAEFIAAMRELEFDAPRGKIRFSESNSAQLEYLYFVKVVKGPDGKYTRQFLDRFPGAPDLPGCTRTF